MYADQQARAYAETARTQIARATQIINEHRAAVAATGAALSGVGYVGYRYYAEGTKDLANYLDSYSALQSKLGDETDAYIEEMRQKSGKMLTETEITSRANMAMLLGIQKDALPVMAEMARAASRQLGGDISYYFESITVGTARESKLWLDNLGIIVDIEEAKRSYAETLGVSADALTTEQEKIAFVNEVLKHSDDLLRDVDFSQASLNETLKRSETSWANLNRELTEGALPVISTLAYAAEGTSSALEGMPGPMKAVIGTGGLLVTAVAGITGPLLLNAVAVSYLATNYDDLVRIWGAARTTAAAYAASIYTRVIPAEVAQAYATGGLTAALYAGAAAGWAFVAPWLPWIAVAGVAVGAGYFLYDLFTKGWEDSALKGTVDWLNTNVPWLTGAFEWLASVLGTVWGWITAIPDAVGSAWSGLTEHPLWQIAETVFRLTPMGMGFTAAELGANAAKDMLAQPVPAAASRTTTVVSPNITYDVRVGDIHTQKLDEAEMENIITRATRRSSKQTQRDIERQLNASIL